MIREAILSALGLRAASAAHAPLPAPAPTVELAAHSDAVHALKNETAAAYSGFQLQARRSGRVTRRMGLGDALGRAIQEVNDDAERMRGIVGEAFKDR